MSKSPTLSQSIFSQLSDIKVFILKPVIIAQLLALWLPFNVLWFFLAEKSQPIVAKIKALSPSTFVAPSLKSEQLMGAGGITNETIALATDYLSQAFILYFIVLLLFLLTHAATISLLQRAISERRSPTVGPSLLAALRRIPSLFFICLLSLLLIGLWLVLSQSLLLPIGGIVFPFGLMILAGLMLMAPVIAIIERRGAIGSSITALKLSYGRQQHFSIFSIVLFLSSLVVVAYMILGLYGQGAEMMFSSSLFVDYAAKTAFGDLPFGVLHLLMTGLVSFGGCFISGFVATITTLCYVTLKETQMVTSGQSTIEGLV